ERGASGGTARLDAATSRSRRRAMANTSSTAVPMTLAAESAGDLMTPNPVSIDQDAPVTEAIALLTDRDFGAAPAIDDAGRPRGVVSRADILVHGRERLLALPPGTTSQTGPEDPTRVRDLMTPAVFSVTADTPARQVVEQMLGLKVHQLFVVD